MAKQTTGFLGGFSGKLGPVVGYQWNGKWCLRAQAAAPKNPRTEAQTAHRELFKQEVQLAAKMRWAVGTTLRDLAREEGLTAYNLFVKVNQPAFSSAEGQLQVDYSALHLSLGSVAPVEFDTMEWTSDNVLNVNFRKGCGDGFDHVCLYLYVPDLGNGFLSAPVYRRSRRIALSLPDSFAGHEAHVYLMVQAANGQWSNSLYAGPIVLNEFLASDPEGSLHHHDLLDGAVANLDHVDARGRNTEVGRALGRSHTAAHEVEEADHLVAEAVEAHRDSVARSGDGGH